MELLGCLWLLCGYSGTLVVVKASLGGYQGGYQCYVVAKWLLGGYQNTLVVFGVLLGGY